MGMTPYQFFDAFVRGNHEDCQQNPGCIRRAFNAAVSASHLADHYWAYNENNDPSKIKGLKNIGKFVEYLSTQSSGSFQDIRSISNAYKHLYTSIDHKKSVYSSISSTGAIEGIQLKDSEAEVVELEEQWPEKSENNRFESRVVFTRKDGQRFVFIHTLNSVIQMWESLLVE